MISVNTNQPINKEVSQEQVSSALQEIVTATGKTKILNENSRVNEHEMFAALLKIKLSEADSNLGSRFLNLFETKFTELKELKADNIVFRATRRALGTLRKSGELTSSVAREVRSFALGKAQLDSQRTELSTSNVTGKTGDTALRALKTALTRFLSNEVASKSELTEFRRGNVERLQPLADRVN